MTDPARANRDVMRRAGVRVSTPSIVPLSGVQPAWLPRQDQCPCVVPPVFDIPERCVLTVGHDGPCVGH